GGAAQDIAAVAAGFPSRMVAWATHPREAQIKVSLLTRVAFPTARFVELNRRRTIESERGAAWERTCMGCKGSRVQISALRPIKIPVNSAGYSLELPMDVLARLTIGGPLGGPVMIFRPS